MPLSQWNLCLIPIYDRVYSQAYKGKEKYYPKETHWQGRWSVLK